MHVQGLGFRDPEQGEGNPVESFKAHLKVRKGDYLAIDSATNSTMRPDAKRETRKCP